MAVVTPTHSPTKSGTFSIIQEIVADTLILDLEEITLDTSFGEDDLDIIDTPPHKSILMKIIQHPSFEDVGLDYHTLLDFELIAELIEYIDEELKYQ